MSPKQMTEREKNELIKRIEKGNKPSNNTSLKDMYKEQTDKNYKDGDRN